MPSLKRLSPARRVSMSSLFSISFLSSFSFLCFIAPFFSIDSIVIGSVGVIIAPKIKDCFSGKSKTKWKITPVNIAEIIVPKIDNAPIGSTLDINGRSLIPTAPSNITTGKKT